MGFPLDILWGVVGYFLIVIPGHLAYRKGLIKWVHLNRVLFPLATVVLGFFFHRARFPELPFRTHFGLALLYTTIGFGLWWSINWILRRVFRDSTGDSESGS